MNKIWLAGDRYISESNREHDLVNIREIAADELALLNSAIDSLGLFNRSYSLLEICEENFLELVEFFQRMEQARGFNDKTWHGCSITLNRLLQNYLSSFRTYIDQHKAVFKRGSSSNLNLFDQFKKQTECQSGNNFSYRFLWELRNYFQHCGLVVGGVDIFPQPGNCVGLFSTMMIYLDRNSLLKVYNWKPALKTEIENNPDRIDIKSHVLQLHDCIHEIAHLCLRSCIELIGEKWDRLRKVVEEVSTAHPDTTPVLLMWEGEKETDMVLTNLTPLPLFTMAKIHEIWSQVADPSNQEGRIRF